VQVMLGTVVIYVCEFSVTKSGTPSPATHSMSHRSLYINICFIMLPYIIIFNITIRFEENVLVSSNFSLLGTAL
jgi:hypothetical protein